MTVNNTRFIFHINISGSLPVISADNIRKILLYVYGDENLGMDGISDKVKRGANVWGYICGKWRIATFWG